MDLKQQLQKVGSIDYYEKDGKAVSPETQECTEEQEDKYLETLREEDKCNKK